MQVVWLKVELCKLLEEKRSAVLRLFYWILCSVIRTPQFEIIMHLSASILLILYAILRGFMFWGSGSLG